MHKRAQFLIRKLKLIKHPEGGYYSEVHRSAEIILPECLPRRYKTKRNYITSIFYMLEGTDYSAFHFLKTDELWHFYEGFPVTIYIINKDGKLTKIILGNNLYKGEKHFYVTQRGTWYALALNNPESYALLGCTLSPGFEYEDMKFGKKTDLIKKFPRHKLLIRKYSFD
ncbi:MAG: cupin domain-containing protein [Ignavibacteria bacterium]|nr:cupin domain-containing protein [Ignavibacteria bacterium]